MTWTILLALAIALALAMAGLFARRQELQAMEQKLEERSQAIQRGSHHARLQYPSIDLSKCLGCGTCVRACPEEGVLELIHGQALVVHGARCVGHGLCAAECPVGAIALTLGDLSQRKDIPVLEDANEAAGRKNIFLAGEVTGFALIRTAIQHGQAVGAEVGRRKKMGTLPTPTTEGYDLIIIGAGPAGLTCALEAKSQGLNFLVLEQDSLGGTVAKYPRRKLVMTQPIEMPLAGKFKRSTYEKEELMLRWEMIAEEHELPIQTGVRFEGITATENGLYRVDSTRGPFVASAVCMALGRRGTPRRLGVPGEDLKKVSYCLIDAQSYQNRKILVVGGGDSAVGAAMGLAEQSGNDVTLSYRGKAFTRIKARNESRLNKCMDRGMLEVILQSNVTEIGEKEVQLAVEENGEILMRSLPNDDVFIMAGGIPPFPLLEQAGVSFDQSDLGAAELVHNRGTGLLPALGSAFGMTLCALALYWWHKDYYQLPLPQRPSHDLHNFLRPSAGLGLLAGILGAALIFFNLSYLARRSAKIPFSMGSLQGWMTSHVATGILALISAVVHSAFSPQDTVGGHAFLGLMFLVATGAIGRYLYSFVPHAANGRELELEEIRADLARMSAEWDRDNRAFGQEVQKEVDRLIQSGRWHGSLLIRIFALIRQQWNLRKSMRLLRNRGREEGLPASQLKRMLALARRAHWNALLATHFEEVRGILASWRYFHRWVALLMVLLLVVHIVTAVRYASLPAWLT